MGATKKISVTIVNRYYPPDGSITSESALDLCKFLISKGVVVNIICTKAAYNNSNSNIARTILGIVHRISGFYQGKNNFLRLISSTVESFLLIRKSLKINADITIVMTSPPLLNYFVALLFRKRKKRWIYWSLDLYPEAFKANKLVNANNLIYKHVLAISYSYPPEAIIALGKNQAAYLNHKFGKNLNNFILPCGVFLNSNNEARGKIPFWKKEKDKIYFGYIGNLGEAHSVDFLKLLIDNLNPDFHRLVLAVYGSKSQELLGYIKNKSDTILLLDHIDRGDLTHIDIHSASLNTEWTHICVPSKLVSAVHQSSCFLFMGPQTSDSWEYLNEAGWRIDNLKPIDDQLKAFLNNLTKDAVRQKQKAAIKLSSEIESDVQLAYNKLFHFLSNDI